MFTEDQVRALDLRRQAQINNQIQAIDRLLEGTGKYDDEMRALHNQLAELKTAYDLLLEREEALQEQLAQVKAVEV